MSVEVLRVEVVYSPAPRVVQRRQLDLPAGSTVADALAASGLVDAATLASLVVSVWCRPQPPEHRLRDRDRIELCRPLRVDPKEARRQRYRRQARAAKAPAAG